MRVIVLVETGEQAGRKVLLKTGEQARFGRTEWADVAVPNDGQLSGVHFQVEAKTEGCRLTDLDSNNGTFVNNQRVKDAWIQQGDAIVAGETRFGVLIEGVDPSSKPGDTLHNEPLPTLGTMSTTYRHAVCDSAIHCYRGNAEEIRPAALASLFAERLALSLIVDLNNVPEDTRPEVPEPRYLMDWIPDESQRRYSPVLLCAADDLDLQAVVAHAWGRDAVVAVFVSLDAELPLQQIRNAAGPFAHPSILRPILSVGAPEFAGNLLSGIAAILVEGELPEEWLIYTTGEFDEQLQDAGLQREAVPADEDSTTADSGHAVEEQT